MITDLSQEMGHALDRTQVRAQRHHEQLQHQTITAILRDVLAGLPHLRWTRPYGHGAAGIIGRPLRGDLAERVSAIAVYAVEAGGKKVQISPEVGTFLVEADVMLAGIPVVVATPIWTKADSWRKPSQDKLEERTQNLLDELGTHVEVRRRNSQP